ncbi:hypothetical protein [Roseateles sp.]|uniref:hypothetical protein n=1 Tax=Roseateles sp. TaxID=1971397 RepID=UPI003BABB523
MADKLQLTEFAGFGPNYQFRASLCREYHRLLTSNAETEVLLLEARPGIGATSLCAEYFNTIDEPAILLTVHARSRLGYSLPYLVEQALRQAYSLLGEEPKGDKSDNILAEWQRTLPKLTRKVKSVRQKLHIVIDGLYQIPPEDEKYQTEVVKEILLFGSPDIKHVLTWRERLDKPVYLKSTLTRIAAIPPLSDNEALALLVAEGVPAKWHKEVIASTGGIPAKLASVARLNALGKLDSINIRSSLDEFYDEEFSALVDGSQCSTDDVEIALSFVTFSKKPLSHDELARLSRISSDCLSRIMNSNGFVHVDNDSGLITLSSITHRDFLSNRLVSRRIAVIKAFVDGLAEAPASSDSIQLLPTYYSELGDHAQTLDLLTVSNLDAYLAASQSITALKQRNDLGFIAATKSKHEVEAFRFALQASIIRSFGTASDNEPLLAALAATGRLDEALQVAESEATNEGKLLLLARYVSLLDSKGLKADASILSQIEVLVNGLDLTADRDRSIDVAEYLIGPYPELAFRIVEESSNGNSSLKDAAYTHFAISQTHPSKEKPRVDRFKEYASKIADSKTRTFIKAAESVLATKSSTDLLDSTQGMDGRQRAFFLRQWLTVHFRESAAIGVAKFALDEAASDTSYAPSASDLRIICIPVIFAKDAAEATELLQRIEIQRTSLIERSSTVDRTRLDLAIARSKVALGQSNGDASVEEIYLNISYIADDGVRLECLCWLQAQLGRFDKLTVETKSTVKQLTESGIQQAVEACLQTTAEHIDVFKGAVSALVEFNPRSAFDIIAKINTAERRDAAYTILIQQLILRSSSEPIPVKLLNEALWKISDEGKRWVALVNCLRSLAKQIPKLDEAPEKLIKLIDSIKDPLGVAYGRTERVKVCQSYSLPIDAAQECKEFVACLAEIDEAFKTPQLFFQFVEAIAKTDKDQASKLLDNYWASDIRLQAQSEDYFGLIESLCRLTMISFAGTLKHRQDSEDALQTVIGAIERLAPIKVQADLLSDLAIRAHAVNRKDVLDAICTSHLVPLVQSQASQNTFTYQKVIAAAYPALFLWNNSFANSLLDPLPQVCKDKARSETIYYLITRTPTSEPYEDDSLKNAKVTWADGVTIVDLIEQIKTDNVLVSSMLDFSFAASSKASSNEISLSQRSELANRLSKKAAADLPEQANIKHDGWKIIARGACAKLAHDVTPATWKSLIDLAKAVPNASDAVYVLGMLSSLLPVKMSLEKVDVVREAESRLHLIPSKVDSVRRAVSLSRLSASVDYQNEMAKRILRGAMAGAVTLKDQQAAIESQRSIIDQAYKIDEDFAQELINDLDDDPARTRAKDAVRAQIAQQKAKGAFIKKKYDEVAKLDDYSGLGWSALASLNAGNVPGHKQDELSAMLPKVVQCSMDDSYGFYWLYLRCLQRKYEHSAVQSKQILVPIAEVTKVALLLAERVGQRIWGNLRRSEAYFEAGGSQKSSYVNVPGSGCSGLDYIRQWVLAQSAGSILICDPYFRPDNIDFVKEISFLREGLEFFVVSCNNEVEFQDLDAAYRVAWSNIAHVEPPPIRIVHMNYEGPKSPSSHVIHDRWIFMGNRGLRVGTSIGSLAGAKLYELSEVQEADVNNVMPTLGGFVEMKQKSLDGKRLRYSVVQW